MVTITLTWAMLKWAGLALFILSIVALVTGSLPDHGGSPAGNALRWVAWPLMLIWLVVMLVKALAT